MSSVANLGRTFGDPWNPELFISHSASSLSLHDLSSYIDHCHVEGESGALVAALADLDVKRCIEDATRDLFYKHAERWLAYCQGGYIP